MTGEPAGEIGSRLRPQRWPLGAIRPNPRHWSLEAGLGKVPGGELREQVVVNLRPVLLRQCDDQREVIVLALEPHALDGDGREEHLTGSGQAVSEEVTHLPLLRSGKPRHRQRMDQGRIRAVAALSGRMIRPLAEPERAYPVRASVAARDG